MDGVLLDDGTNGNGGSVLAPYFPSSRDYSVEVDLQFIRYNYVCGGEWGITVRGGYSIGGSASCNGEDSIVFISNGDTNIAEAPHTMDTAYHTYRVEATSNTIRLFIDGQQILEGTDNVHLNPGRIGLSSRNAQLAIKAVRIALAG